jgi:hypothetical protein
MLRTYRADKLRKLDLVIDTIRERHYDRSPSPCSLRLCAAVLPDDNSDCRRSKPRGRVLLAPLNPSFGAANDLD